MTDCLFCKIIAGEIPSQKVYEDDKCLAFKDIAPLAPVHFLVVPKAHFASAAEVTEENAALIGHIYAVIAKLAKEMGFATHVADDPLAKAMELARVIANKNPHAIRGAKRMCNALATATDGELLQMESDEQLKVMRTPNQMEAVMAGMQKRKPNFAD